MGSYRAKSQSALTWLDNRDQIKLDLRKIMRKLENSILDEAGHQFDQALADGKLIEQRFDAGRIISLIKQKALDLPEPKKRG